LENFFGKTYSPGLPFSPQEGNTALTQDLVIKHQLSRPACHAETNVQRQEVFLAGVAIAGRRGFFPLNQAFLSLWLRVRAGAGINQPVLEGVISWVR
jgi:hypothetical protein